MCGTHIMLSDSNRIDWEESARSYPYNPDHESTVNNILRDRDDGWRHNYYESTTTLWDLPCARIRQTIGNQHIQIRAFESTLQKITKKIENSKRNPKDPLYIKLSQKAVADLESDYIEIYKNKGEIMVQMSGAENRLQECKWKQYLEAKRYEMLHTVRNNFMNDINEERLRASVSWVEEYIKDLRLKMS